MPGHRAQLTCLSPERFELFLLGEGEKKVTYTHDTRVPNTMIFTFNKEDHTLGNLLTAHLHKYKYVTFSAYISPHPLTPSFDLRVSTDGSVTPKDAVVQCCKDVVKELEVLSNNFLKEMELRKIANQGRE
ncbi:RBP11-like subunits of RNA polymerase [Eremomyces bilateralis CBS 781.70]|uniref:RBP11-like subunits of RNA polymerase n=1 Tax=Eremomyces bilateralis CBS 781.70 TaxID=1392243 RepID=A0A6G1GD02_9PEZI|nr:RBP11-like subunits of RNA polymerase [Eremomyces bilateralis CBS 781.70]KAF1815914.1 RBP11-like subunits of RNA polymerase [Eremomyces bilateralis CBS 781.70]